MCTAHWWGTLQIRQITDLDHLQETLPFRLLRFCARVVSHTDSTRYTRTQELCQTSISLDVFLPSSTSLVFLYISRMIVLFCVMHLCLFVSILNGFSLSFISAFLSIFVSPNLYYFYEVYLSLIYFPPFLSLLPPVGRSVYPSVYLPIRRSGDDPLCRHDAPLRPQPPCRGRSRRSRGRHCHGQGLRHRRH